MRFPYSHNKAAYERFLSSSRLSPLRFPRNWGATLRNSRNRLFSNMQTVSIRMYSSYQYIALFLTFASHRDRTKNHLLKVISLCLEIFEHVFPATRPAAGQNVT